MGGVGGVGGLCLRTLSGGLGGKDNHGTGADGPLSLQRQMEKGHPGVWVSGAVGSWHPGGGALQGPVVPAAEESDGSARAHPRAGPSLQSLETPSGELISLPCPRTPVQR